MRGILDIYNKWRNILHKSKEQAVGTVVFKSSGNGVFGWFHLNEPGTVVLEYTLEDGTMYRRVYENTTEELIEIHDLPSDPTVKITGNLSYLQLAAAGSPIFDMKSLDGVYFLYNDEAPEKNVEVIDLRNTSVSHLVLTRFDFTKKLNLAGLKITEILRVVEPNGYREIWYDAVNEEPSTVMAEIISSSPAGGTIHLAAGEPYNDVVIAAAHDNGWHVIQRI